MAGGTTVVTLRLPTATERELTERAQAEGTTRAELCAQVLGEWLTGEPETEATSPSDVRLTVDFPRAEGARLDEIARRSGVTTDEVVRRLVRHGWAAVQAKAEAERATASRLS